MGRCDLGSSSAGQKSIRWKRKILLHKGNGQMGNYAACFRVDFRALTLIYVTTQSEGVDLHSFSERTAIVFA